ncbi:carboxylesterase family protein [Pseudomonas yamanorum]
MSSKEKNGSGSLPDTGITRLTGIRYAQAERFQPPQPVLPPEDLRSASTLSKIPCQLPSRLERVMGKPSVDMPQSEDCLLLDITLPAGNVENRAVMVWFHGGGYFSGGGGMPWYGAEKLAQEGNLIVVNVSYRLGVFGYLMLDGVCQGNLGLLDQIEAVRWVNRHIAKLGGNPNNITLFGQSAGAHSIAYMMAMGKDRPLFAHAILQSPPMGSHQDQKTARAFGNVFAALLGKDPLSATVEELLAAQAQAAAQIESVMIVGPIVDCYPLPGLPELEKAWSACRIPTLMGWVDDEALPFLPVVDGEHLSKEQRKLAMRQHGKALTHSLFTDGIKELASTLADGTQPVYLYNFSWQAPDSIWGAAHCIELPFLLGDEGAWSTAPMLEGAVWSDLEIQGKALRSIWLEFARSASAQEVDTSPSRPWRIWRVGKRA